MCLMQNMEMLSMLMFDTWLDVMGEMTAEGILRYATPLQPESLLILTKWERREGEIMSCNARQLVRAKR